MKHCCACSLDSTILTSTSTSLPVLILHLACTLSSTSVVVVCTRITWELVKTKISCLHSRVPRWDPRTGMSNKFSRDMNDTGLGTTLWEHLPRAQVTSETYFVSHIFGGGGGDVLSYDLNLYCSLPLISPFLQFFILLETYHT